MAGETELGSLVRGRH